MQDRKAPIFAASQFKTGDISRRAAAALLAVAMIAAGCNSKQTAEQPAPRADQQVASDIEAKLSAESALNGQDIQVAVNGGVATLSGTASDNASRALAGNEAGSISGVKTVVNNLNVAPPPPPAHVAAAPQSSPKPKAEPAPRKPRQVAEAAPAPVPPTPAAEPEPTPAPEVAAIAPPPPQPPPPPATPEAAPLPAPPAPVAKTVVLPEGTLIPVRMIDALDSENAQPSQSFRGTLAGDLIVDGMVALPQGTIVSGRVADARDAAHFKGSSLLSIELTAIDSRGRSIPVVTDTYTKEGAGRGKNTVAKAAGGAALGGIIGALAGGGKGAAIGAAAGGGAGTAVNGVTRGQQVQIPSETLVNFHLQTAISVTTSRVLGGPRENPNTAPQLEPRTNPQAAPQN